MRKYVGERIQKLREAQGLTQQEVCKLTGIKLARLQAFEDGSAVPSVGVIIMISRVLGSKIEGLLHGGGTVSEALTICRAGKSEPFMLIFDPNLPKGPPISHDGQEFLYVVSGTIGLFYDGKEYNLEQGDSVYLDSSRSHTLYCLGDKPAQLLAVVSAQV
ncbi:MAG: cupin domain-containing protein [Deltaproteobacteria bacterium]|nr:cupin domain-containing protein [Deltaproteobacteria bacterium]